MKYRLARTSIATATLVASAQAADAHIVASRLGDFYTGALHPLTDLQDLILWVAMGVLAGSLGAAKGRWLVLAVRHDVEVMASNVAGTAFQNDQTWIRLIYRYDCVAVHPEAFFVHATAQP